MWSGFYVEDACLLRFTRLYEPWKFPEGTRYIPRTVQASTVLQLKGLPMDLSICTVLKPTMTAKIQSGTSDGKMGIKTHRNVISLEKLLGHVIQNETNPIMNHSGRYYNVRMLELAWKNHLMVHMLHSISAMYLLLIVMWWLIQLFRCDERCLCSPSAMKVETIKWHCW